MRIADISYIIQNCKPSYVIDTETGLIKSIDIIVAEKSTASDYGKNIETLGE